MWWIHQSKLNCHCYKLAMGIQCFLVLFWMYISLSLCLHSGKFFFLSGFKLIYHTTSRISFKPFHGDVVYKLSAPVNSRCFYQMWHMKIYFQSDKKNRDGWKNFFFMAHFFTAFVYQWKRFSKQWVFMGFSVYQLDYRIDNVISIINCLASENARGCCGRKW